MLKSNHVSPPKNPCPPPPPGRLSPGGEPFLDFPIRDAIVRDFCRKHGDVEDIPEDKPLGRWLAGIEGATVRDGVAHVTAPPEVSRDREIDLNIYARLMDYALLDYLVWSIRVLENQPSGRVEISKSIVTDELLGEDLAGNDPRREILMPAGIHTLRLAARLLQGGRGTIRVKGRTSEGRDIEWEPAVGGLAWFEVKDRAFRAAYDDPIEKFLKSAEAKTLLAADKMPPNPDAARIVFFGGVRPFNEAKALRDFYREAADNFDWGQVPEDKKPDAVAIDVIALKYGDYVSTYLWTSLAETKQSRTSPAYQRIQPAIADTFGTKEVELTEGVDTSGRPSRTVRRQTPKVGRNDPCPCGSGKKHKKCCGR